MSSYRQAHFPETGFEPPALLQRSPSGYMRLHHFEQNVINGWILNIGEDPIRMALRGETDQEKIAQQVHKRALSIVEYRDWLNAKERRSSAFLDGSRRYIHDWIADWTVEQVERMVSRPVAYAAKLALLPDDAIIKLGASADVHCESCAIGNHCMLRDNASYSSFPERDNDVVQGEQESTESILRRLALPGLERGIDYLTGIETVPVREQDGSTVSVDASYMLVTMGAARTLLRPREILQPMLSE